MNTEDKVASQNLHLVNVLADSLSLVKYRMGDNAVIPGSTSSGQVVFELLARDPDGSIDIPGKSEKYKVVGTYTTDEDGVAFIEKTAIKPYSVPDATENGADYHYYYIREIKAPDGYVKMGGFAEVILKITNTYYTLSLLPPPVQAPYDAAKLQNWEQNATLSMNTTSQYVSPDLDEESQEVEGRYRILNNPGAELPATGGFGTIIFYTTGLLLTTLAGFILLMKRTVGNE